MEKQEPKKIERVVTGEVREKKSLLKSFLAEDLGTVGGYILSDVIVPNVKKAVLDTVSNGFEMLLYGEVRSAKSSNTLGSRVSYNKIYDGRQNSVAARSETSNRRLDYMRLIFDSKSEAEAVLTSLIDIIDRYEVCAVSDLYETIGRSGDAEFTDNKYGWTNLGSAQVLRERDGYWLKLPKAMPI